MKTKGGIYVMMGMDGGQSVIKCSSKLTTWSFTLPRRLYFITIRKKCAMKNIRKNSGWYTFSYEQAKLKWLKNMYGKAEEEETVKLVKRIEEAEEQDKGEQLANKIEQQEENDGLFREDKSANSKKLKNIDIDSEEFDNQMK